MGLNHESRSEKRWFLMCTAEASRVYNQWGQCR